MLDKNQKISVQIRLKIYIENFFNTLFSSFCVALVCLLQQIYYSAEQVQEP